jgi:hypothetical protein
MPRPSPEWILNSGEEILVLVCIIHVAFYGFILS